MGCNTKIVTPWSDLPRELFDRIAKCLDTEIDVLRFRAVCSLWRSSTTPFKKFPSETVKLPFPFDAREVDHGARHHGAYFSLVERIVYRVALPDSKQPNFWLVKIERLSDGKFRILNPVSHRRVKILPETQMPKVLNTLDFGISEVCKAYTLKYENPSEPNENYEYRYAKKVILSVGKNDEYVVMAIDNKDNLWYLKSGDEKWTVVGNSFTFHDVVKYKVQLHGIDPLGGTWAFDSGFESTRVSNNMNSNALKRHLVKLYNGELLLVEEVNKRCPTLYNAYGAARKPNVDIIIYALDKNEKEWIETKPVNDFIIVVGDDCSYSFSTEGFEGTRFFYPEWCIIIDSDAEEDFDPDYLDFLKFFYTSNFIPSNEVKLRFRGFHGENVGVCDYETGKTGSALMFPEYADIFWPPPSWLNRT